MPSQPQGERRWKLIGRASGAATVSCGMGLLAPMEEVEVCEVSELEAEKDRSMANSRELCRQRNRAEAAEKALEEAVAVTEDAETLLEEKMAAYRRGQSLALDEKDEAERRAEVAEKALKDLADWLDAEASMLTGYEAAAGTERSAYWNAGAAAALQRVQEKLATHIQEEADTR